MTPQRKTGVLFSEKQELDAVQVKTKDVQGSFSNI